MGQEVDFSRPPPETDKLYMNIGGNDVIEVGHPPPPPEAKHWVRNTIHLFLSSSHPSGAMNKKIKKKKKIN